MVKQSGTPTFPSYAERCREPDLALALRESVEIFHAAHASDWVAPAHESNDSYCDYVCSFICSIWMSAVRDLLQNSYRELGFDKEAIANHKLRVCNNLRLFLPGTCQPTPRAFRHFYAAFRDAAGTTFPGPLGIFLDLHVVPYLRNRHRRELLPLEERKRSRKEFRSNMIARGDGVYNIAPSLLGAGGFGVASGSEASAEDTLETRVKAGESCRQ